MMLPLVRCGGRFRALPPMEEPLRPLRGVPHARGNIILPSAVVWDERLPAGEFQDPDQRTHPRGVLEGHSREVDQDARTRGFHHRFGSSLLEWIRGREVDLAMREEPSAVLASPQV